MNKTFKIIYYCAISMIAIWFIRPIVFWIIGLEFVDSKLEFQYLFIWRYILPIAICLTIVKEFLNGNRPIKLVKSILIRLGISVFSVLIVYISLFTQMCGWIEKDIYYISKRNSSKIVLMEYGCGAYDSDSNPKTEIRKITPLNNSFNWSHQHDIAKINQNDWEKVK